jgi:hypothetical protein
MRDVPHNRRVIEYLIRTQYSDEWPPVHRDGLAKVLIPAGFDCDVVDGWGDLRLRCGEAEVSFSGEEPGWALSVEGDLTEVEAFIARVTEQVSQAVGEPCEWIAL